MIDVSLFLMFPCRNSRSDRQLLKKCTLLDHVKEKWVKCVVTECMSSEESDDDKDVIMVKPLLWRAAKATKTLQNLDLLGIEGETKQAQRQRMERVLSSKALSRPKPVLASLN